MRCSQCGHEIPAAKAFCTGCGAPAGGARPQSRARKDTARAAASAPRSRPAPPGRPTSAPGLSIWWIVIPTLLYAGATLHVRGIAVLVALGFVLRGAQSRPELPAGVRLVLPLVQPVAAFILLGGNPLPVVISVVLGAAAVQLRDVFVPALEPWWRVQQSLPRGRRFLLAIVFTLAIGYFFGGISRTHDWAVTSASVTVGAVVTFLFTFDPPPIWRKPGRSRPRRGEA